MAERAAQQIEGIAHEMAMDARFFGGDNPRVRAQAGEAQQLAEASEKWARDIEGLIPDDGQTLSQRERQALLQQAPRQSGISDRARKVQEKLGELSKDEGIPGHVPEQISESIEYMEKAAEALRQPRPASAQDHQREALDRLAKLKEQLQ